MNIARASLARGGATAALAALALLPLAGAAHAASGTAAEVDGPNIVVNGGFERGADPGVKLAIPAGSPLLDGWATANEVAVVGTYWQAEEGTRSLALANYGSAATTGGSVKQTLTTIPGRQYRVVFYQAGNPGDHQPSMIRCVAGSQPHDFTYQADSNASMTKMEWIKRTFTFTAASAATPLSFTAAYTPGNDYLGLDNVQVRAIEPTAGVPSGGPVATTTTLRLASATVAAGGKQSVQVTTGKNAALTLVLDYPDGTQAAVSAHAGPDGRYAYAWSVPAGVHGVVHVLVDGAGSIAQGSFTAS